MYLVTPFQHMSVFACISRITISIRTLNPPDPTFPQTYTMTNPSHAALLVKGLNFDFGAQPILTDLNLELKRGSRCLLIGANGAGKSTLLRIVAGKNMTKGTPIMALGRDVFREGSGDVTYLGTEWANNPVVRGDVPVSRLLKTLGATRHPERCAELLEIMDVNCDWHMHQISDGQRRRVQIVLGLLEPFSLLLLDEVTVDLDVLVRADLLAFLAKETEQRGATILYATHIFDGLGNWPTHIAHVADGHIDIVRDLSASFPELDAVLATRSAAKNSSSLLHNSPLLLVVEQWLRQDYKVLNERRRNKETGVMMSRWDVLSENMKEYGDKYYNYWT